MADTDADARIQEAIPERAALLRTLAATQHAKPMLAAVLDRMAEVQDQHRAAADYWGHTHKTTECEKADLDALRHQHVRKWFQDRGVRQQQLDKEEREYLEALSVEEKAKAAETTLFNQLAELRRERDRLRVQVDEGAAAAVALEALYARVFAGPTPASPEEDALEAHVRAVEATHDAIQARVFVCATVSNEVALALACANRAVQALGASLAASEADMFVVGTPTPATALAGQYNPHASAAYDSKERDGLRTAQRNIAQAEHHMATAQQLAPDAVGDFFRPALTDAHTLNAHLDFWLDTPVTDYLFHRDLRTTQDNVLLCHRVLAHEADRANARLDDVRRELAPVAAQLDALRRELFSVRAGVFARIVHDDAPPPPYSEA